MNGLCNLEFNSYMFLVFSAHLEEEHTRLNHLLRRVADRARTWDEYELSDEIYSIAGSQTRILWYNLEWTIEDFLSLMIAADDLELARNNSAYQDESGRGQSILTNTEEDPYPSALLDDPIVSPHRTFLKCFLLWFSIYFDTRIQRLFCKMSNVLEELELTWPPPRKVVAMRSHLFNCLGHYIFGYCSMDYFQQAVAKAYTSGTTLISSIEETAADIDSQASADQLIFDPHESVFGTKAYSMRLVIRTRDSSLQKTSLSSSSSSSSPASSPRRIHMNTADGGEDDDAWLNPSPSLDQ
jgi:hypothetical protein